MRSAFVFFFVSISEAHLFALIVLRKQGAGGGQRFCAVTRRFYKSALQVRYGGRDAMALFKRHDLNALRILGALGSNGTGIEQ